MTWRCLSSGVTLNRMNKRLTLSVEAENPAVIRVQGELDYVNCDSLRKLIRATTREQDSIVLDLDSLEFMDSSGLRVLVRAACDAHLAGHPLKITAMTPQVRHVLNVTSFDRLFELPAPEPETADRDRPRALVGTAIFSIPCGTSAPREGRKKAYEFAESMGFDQSALDDVRLAIGEAVTNAIRHGRPEKGSIRLECRALEDELKVNIKYPSSAFNPDDIPVPNFDPPAEGGMGIYFMRLVMDEVTYSFSNGSATLSLRKSR